MAQRRMFSLKIVDSARFLKMPTSTRLLYYDLCMRADDDGVVEGFNILKITGATEDDLRVLVSKNFIKILNEDLVSYITDWSEHNKIRADRKVNSIYKDLLLEIIPDVKLIEPRRRADLKRNDNNNGGRPVDRQVSDKGQHRLGKDRLGEDSISKVSIVQDSIGKVNKTISKDIVSSTKVQPIIRKWNELGLQRIIAINSGTKRDILLNARLKEYGENKIIQAIENIKKSSFLKGQNKTNWIITFDWFIRPNNFIKVLEGNYTDNPTKAVEIYADENGIREFNYMEGGEYGKRSNRKSL